MGFISAFLGPVTNKIFMVLIAVLLAAAGFFYYEYTSYQTKYDATKSDLDTTKAQLKATGEQLTKLMTSQAISSDTRTKIDDDKTVVDKKVDVIQSTSKKQVEKIVDKYKELPTTPQNQQAEASEISNVRVNSLWDTYCVSGATDTPCVTSAAASAALVASGVAK